MFYRRSKAYLHFHEDPTGLFADLRTGEKFERFRVSSAGEQSHLLALVTAGEEPKPLTAGENAFLGAAPSSGAAPGGVARCPSRQLSRIVPGISVNLAEQGRAPELHRAFSCLSPCGGITFRLATPGFFSFRTMSQSRKPTTADLQKMSVAEQHEWLQTQRSRRSMLKGGLVGAGALIAGPALGAASAGASTLPSSRPGARRAPTVLLNRDRLPGTSVAPFGRHISYGQDPRRQMNITWQVNAPVTNPFVRVGRSPAELDLQVEAELVSLTTPFGDVTALDSVPLVPPTEVEQWYVHASLDWLTPGETYYYSVGHRGLEERSADGVQVNSFTLAPRDPGAFRFTAFGDQGVSYDAVSTSRVIAGQNPAFHLHAGDVSYAESGGSGLLTDSYDPRVFDSWFAQIEGVASNIPWMVGIGNHEMEPWYPTHGYGGQLARFAFLANAPGSCPVSYSFTYGNVGFISLDANDVSYELQANLGYTGGAQTTWLGSRSRRSRGPLDRLHRGVLPPVRLLHLQRARQRRRDRQVLDAAVRPVPGRPRHQRSQPHLRTDRSDPGRSPPARRRSGRRSTP